MVGRLAQNFLRNIQQRDVAHVFRLLTGLADPEISVVVPDDMLRGQLLHVDEGQPREGGEDEDVADQLAVDLRERQILFPVTLTDQLGQITPATLVTADRNQRIIRPDQRPALVVVLLHGPQQRADLFRLLRPEEELLQQVGRDEAVLLLQFAKDLIQLDAGLLDIGVQVAGAAALAAGRLLGLALQGRVDALADVVLDARPVDGDAHRDGGLSVFQQPGLLEEEQHAKRISFHGSYLLFNWFDKCRKSDPI